ncbi:hypothetical protein DRN93_01705 [archaeon]|nr:MAG: hypothetical protein DRN93_01705 [archaeon]
MEVSNITYSYRDVPTVYSFTVSSKRIKCIMGPFGSGKSSGCVMALLRYATQQMPDADGVRKTRYAVVRNTVKELKDTTKKTIDEWISRLRPKWRESENKYLIEFALEDGTIVQSEWLLRALDRPEQVKDLLSLELSGAWINEAREVPLEVFEVLDGRIDRYPRKMGRYKCSYPFLILDTNPPDTDSWLYKYFEEKPLSDPQLAEKIGIWKQPSGLSPQAENLRNLPDGYYQNLAIGKDPDYVKVYIHGEYGYLREGKPVFPNFSYSVHVSAEPLYCIRGVPLTIGMDFGLFPAAVITQVIPDGRFRVLAELASSDATDLEEFVTQRLRPLLAQEKFRRYTYYIIGDPAGASRSQLDSRTCFMLLRRHGFQAYPAYTNSLQPRLQAVNQYLTRMINGEPAFRIDSSCSTLIKALSGKYCFRKMKLSGERYSEVPDKGPYSHIADALQYACLGYTPNQVERDSFSYYYEDVNFESGTISREDRDYTPSKPLIIPM